MSEPTLRIFVKRRNNTEYKTLLCVVDEGDLMVNFNTIFKVCLFCPPPNVDVKCFVDYYNGDNIVDHYVKEYFTEKSFIVESKFDTEMHRNINRIGIYVSYDGIVKYNSYFKVHVVDHYSYHNVSNYIADNCSRKNFTIHNTCYKASDYQWCSHTIVCKPLPV